MIRILFILLALVGCSTPGERARHDGEQLVRQLTARLEQIRSREELLQAQPELRKLFLSIAQLAAQADSSSAPAPSVDPLLNRRLKEEMIRIYALDGGRQLIEEAQKSALYHLVHCGR